MTGFKWNAFTVIRQCSPPKNAVQTRRYWECLCECGSTRVYSTAKVNSQKTESCGCRFLKRNRQSRGRNNVEILDDFVSISTKNGETFLMDYDDYLNSEKDDIHWYIHENTHATKEEKYVISKRKIDSRYNVVKLHNYIMNPPDNMVVDHIDGNTMDNRKSNLRIVTQQQNSWNKSVAVNNTSGVKGVSRVRRSGKWVSRITHNGKRITLGTFENFQDAVLARVEAEKELYGEYSRLNSDKTFEGDVNYD